ncbi:hypothetical protein VKT23_002670 [Stygiomarasmius scandens]|uniref:F-box domain-containing protein n=1 Tax=Marasmiellus scandens TaxID=2682957 RepID=A0ABR1K3Y8_9AGAR
MKISFVCAGWRELARSMPKLWSFLYFGGFSSQRDSLPLGNLQLVISTHLELSQQHTLDFEVALYAPIKPEIFEFLLKPIVANANRWRDVALRLPIDIFLQQDLAPVKGNLSLLRKLALSSNGNSWDASALDAFEIAPSLRSLRLISGVPTNLRLPWKQISNHTIEYSSLSTALRALSSTTEATHVTLLQCDQLESTSTQNIIIHSLRSLSIVINRKNPGFYYWFKWLTLPRLNHLEILGDESLAPESSSHVPEYFSSFLSRSSCTITSLSLVGLAIGDVNTVSILSSLTSLSTLTIHELKYWKTNKMISANLLNALTVDLGSGFSPTKAKICRHLEHLDLCFHGTFSAKWVIDAINSRWIPVPKYAALLGVDSIKSVRIQVIMSKDAKYFDMKELDEAMGLCKAAGLKFYSSPKFLT